MTTRTNKQRNCRSSTRRTPNGNDAPFQSKKSKVIVDIARVALVKQIVYLVKRRIHRRKRTTGPTQKTEFSRGHGTTVIHERRKSRYLHMIADIRVDIVIFKDSHGIPALKNEEVLRLAHVCHYTIHSPQMPIKAIRRPHQDSAFATHFRNGTDGIANDLYGIWTKHLNFRAQEFRPLVVVRHDDSIDLDIGISQA